MAFINIRWLDISSGRLEKSDDVSQQEAAAVRVAIGTLRFVLSNPRSHNNIRKIHVQPVGVCSMKFYKKPYAALFNRFKWESFNKRKFTPLKIATKLIAIIDFSCYDNTFAIYRITLPLQWKIDHFQQLQRRLILIHFDCSNMCFTEDEAMEIYKRHRWPTN